jgi:hypothetical protein
LPKGEKVEIEGEIVETHQHFFGVATVSWIQEVPHSEEQYLVGLKFIELFGDSKEAIKGFR